MAKHFRGIMVPVMTPINKNGEIDYDAYRKHVDWLIENGADSFLVPSGTGEYENLTWDERENLVRITAEEAKGKYPVVALTNDCSTRHVLHLCERFKKAGATEVMFTPPYYTHIDQRAIIEMYTTVADECGMPVWLYDQPGETKLTIEPDTVVQLAKHPNIVGIKIAAAEDFFYFCQITDRLKNDDKFSILMGEDWGTLPSYIMGGDGSVSSIANVIPGSFRDIFKAVNDGDIQKAIKLQDYISDVFNSIVMVDTGCYHSSCKAVLTAMGLYPSNTVSRPFVEILPEEEKRVLSDAKRLGLI